MHVIELQPQALWQHFNDLNAVPRPSKDEQRVRDFMLAFAKANSLQATVDAIGNVIITKPATAGMESRKTVILQSHLDMVHQKNNDTAFDFQNEGIKMVVEDNIVHALGTTLGADNGIGVAAIMAVLSSKDISHPAIEALFTIDEETGMTGAKELDKTILTGSILLNLDTEEDDEIDIGCAGGVDVTGTAVYDKVDVNASFTTVTITISGLQGGHSGMDIHKGFGNANKIMARILDAMHRKGSLQLVEIKGGSLRNAIPREAVFTLAYQNEKQFKSFESCKKAILDEYASIEKNLAINIKTDAVTSHAITPENSATIVRILLGIQNGVYRMSPDMANLVEASNNLARVTLLNGALEIACLTRSSVDSTKVDLSNSIIAVMELGALKTETTGDYPGWKPNPNSAILKIAKAKYESLFNKTPRVVACHAGLECGILGERYPELDMISFGPNIRGAHSPDEHVEIDSVQKFWEFLKEVLKSIPE